MGHHPSTILGNTTLTVADLDRLAGCGMALTSRILAKLDTQEHDADLYAAIDRDFAEWIDDLIHHAAELIFLARCALLQLDPPDPLPEPDSWEEGTTPRGRSAL